MVKTPISAINPRSRHKPAGRSSARYALGFTLIELLVVVGIASLLIAIVPTSLERLREGSQYRDTVRSLLTDLKQARQAATVRGESVQFGINLDARKFGIPGRTTTDLPLSLEIRTTVATGAGDAGASMANITFLGGGGSTGGTIELIRKSGAGVRIKVDWLTGKVTQEPF